MTFDITEINYVRMCENIVPNHTCDQYSILVSKSGITATQHNLYGGYSRQEACTRWRRYNAELSRRMDIWALESQVEHKWLMKYSIQITCWTLKCSWAVLHAQGEDRTARRAMDGTMICLARTCRLSGGEEVKLLSLVAYRFYETVYFYKQTPVAWRSILHAPDIFEGFVSTVQSIINLGRWSWCKF
jgi:hypothetical protein